jgi:YD repeat-containing protein
VYQYDAAHNLKALVGTGPDGNPLVGYRYTLDSSGNRVVVSAMEASTAPLKLSQGRIGYDALGRPAAREDGTKFRYDARGNLVGIDGPSPAALTWDDFGRLTGFSTDSSTVSRYDALGLRAERTAGGATRRFVYDVSGAAPRVMMETDDAGSPVAYYVYGLGLLWKVTADGQTYFYHFDGDGNVVALSSPAAGVVNRYRYDALGRLAASDETVENAFRARGASGWVDDGNGLIYTGAGFWYPELRLTLPATLDLSPTAPKSLPVLTGGGACLMQGLTECSLGTARRMP